jgi:hypothetical protein
MEHSTPERTSGTTAAEKHNPERMVGYFGLADQDQMDGLYDLVS